MEGTAMLSDNELRYLCGQNAHHTQGNFALIHLESPRLELTAERTRDFDPDTFFACDCPICQLTKASGVVVFDDDDSGNIETCNTCGHDHVHGQYCQHCAPGRVCGREVKQ